MRSLRVRYRKIITITLNKVSVRLRNENAKVDGKAHFRENSKN